MTTMNILEFSFSDLASAPLIVDAVYRGGDLGHVGDDPLSRLLGGGNQGGIRFIGRLNPFSIKLCILYSDFSRPEWPDHLDQNESVLRYYGDNRTAGRSAEQTKRRGNRVLRGLFERALEQDRAHFPPIFFFVKHGRGRDVVFKGLAVPLSSSPDGDPTGLKIVRHSVKGRDCENYLAHFRILDATHIPRAWLHDIHRGCATSSSAPKQWIDWINRGETDHRNRSSVNT